MVSTDNYKNAVQPFLKALSPKWLLPLAPVGATIGKNSSLTTQHLGKTPGRFNTRYKVWSGLTGDYIRNGVPSKEEFEEFCQWPTPNVGVLGRAYPGIDSDVSTPEAARLVHAAVMAAFGNDCVYGERLRGDGPRKLYAFVNKAPSDTDNCVRTRRIVFELGGEKQQVDIQGYGSHYVIAGIHPSLDKYEWHPDRPITNSDLTEIDNEDATRFVEILTEMIAKAGGELKSTRTASGAGEEYDTTELEARYPVKDVLKGLDLLPNNPENFLHRDDIVSALAAIRAALGKECLNAEVEDAIFSWATADTSWCPEDYFDKIWKSVSRVRVEREALDILFRRNNIHVLSKHAFGDDAPLARAEIKKHKAEHASEKERLLSIAASRYIFGHVNTREDKAKTAMRDRWNVEREWNGYEWWRSELAETDVALVNGLHAIDGYAANKAGFANFLRDIQIQHPEAWYSGEARHPGFDKGEIVKERQPDGSTKQLVNMRFISQVIREARKPDPDPAQSQKDVRTLLDFIKRLFGPMAEYELDTQAYMAQTGDRPGSLLFLVGESGVGKSIFIHMQSAMFDGVGAGQSGVIDGSKLGNESARRFIFGGVEGCRIVSVRELPEGNRANDMAAITSQLKQLVDPGPDADYISVERKGKDARLVQNFSRILISSNYANALKIEQQDRRIFYVEAKITTEEKPDEDYYSELVAVIHNPVRLAAFWRYLLGRDVSSYTRYTPPPASTEKKERITSELTLPHQRHSRAAIELLRASDRQLFDSEEFLELLNEMSKREHLNSGGEIPKVIYTRTKEEGRASPEFMAALKVLRKTDAVKLPREMRTASKRQPTIYVMAKYAPTIPDLFHMDIDRLKELVEDEYDRGYGEHPWKAYKKAPGG